MLCCRVFLQVLVFMVDEGFHKVVALFFVIMYDDVSES